MEPSETVVAVWTDDWIFFSRIDGVARHFGGTVLMVKTGVQCTELFASRRLRGMLVDLQVAGADLEPVVGALPQGTRVVGYGSHIDAASLRSARDLGLNPVMPRSLFVEKMPKEWEEWFGSTTGVVTKAAPKSILDSTLGSALDSARESA